MLTRRDFIAGTSCLAFSSAYCRPARSVEAIDPRVAIIDLSENAAAWIPQLKERGVVAVGRYYARKQQWQGKRIAFNKIGGRSEIDLLRSSNIAVISIYQYLSSNPKKFLTGLADTGSAKAEASQDAQAALQQATNVGQPEGTPIFFGVDFNLRQNQNQLIQAVVTYFQRVRDIVGDKYRLGAYGNGLANRILREKNLIEFSWVSGSRSFAETTQFISSDNWHLFQNKVDRRFGGSACPSGIGIDTNIQNPKFSDVGAWGASSLSGERVVSIYSNRRFAKVACPILSKPQQGAARITKVRCIYTPEKGWQKIDDSVVGLADNVRVLQTIGAWIAVDSDEDDKLDGYCLSSNFTSSLDDMPTFT